MRMSFKDKLDAIFCFGATATVIVYDLHEPVKNSCALVAIGGFEVSSNKFMFSLLDIGPRPKAA